MTIGVAMCELRTKCKLDICYRIFSFIRLICVKWCSLKAVIKFENTKSEKKQNET